MIAIFVWVIIVAILAGLALWVINQVTSDPQITKVARIAIVVAAVLVILGLFAGVFGIDVGVPMPTANPPG